MLAEEEERDLREEAQTQALGQCNPCYNSSLGPNPHYPFNSTALPNYQTVGNSTTYKGPVASDADVQPAGSTPYLGADLTIKPAAAPAAPKPALAEIECNPCYNSSNGPNPHYEFKGTTPVLPNY
jgi:hypothetical protein